MKRFSIMMAIVCLFCQGLPVVALAAETDWKLSAEVDYLTGTYGTDSRTDTVYVPVTLKRYFGMGDVALTLPYIYQRGSALVTNVGGMPVKIKQKPATGTVPVTANNGVGDLLLKGRFYLLEEDHAPFGLSLVGKVKFPTADRNKGLGTGEFDEGGGVEFSKALPHDWTLYTDVSYTFIGSPPGTSLKNQLAFDIGAAQRFTREVTGSFYYEESTPLVSGTPDQRDILATIEYKVSKAARLYAGATVGLSQSTADFGATAGVSIRF